MRIPEHIGRYGGKIAPAVLAIEMASGMLGAQENGNSKVAVDTASSAITVLLPHTKTAEELELAIAQKTVGVMAFSQRDSSGVENLDVIYQVYPLSSRWVWEHFGETPVKDEQWYAVVHAPTYNKDGGFTQLRMTQESKEKLSIYSTYLSLINSLLQRIWTDSHLGDVEVTITFVQVIGNQNMYYKGTLIERHGNWNFYPVSTITFIDGHPYYVISEGKHATYISLEECDTEEILLVLRILENTIPIGILPDTCYADVLHTPRVNLLRNVGERNNPNNPFIWDPELSKKYKGESPFTATGGDNYFCAGKNSSIGQDTSCDASFRWMPAQNPGLIAALNEIAVIHNKNQLDTR